MKESPGQPSTVDFNRRVFERRFHEGDATTRERRRLEWTVGQVPPGVRTILEVGSGDGFLTNRLTDLGFQVTGIDLIASSPKNLQGGCVRGSAMALPFRAGCFDLTLCAEVIEHLTDVEREQAVAELWRVARKHVLMTTPDSEDLETDSIRCDRCHGVFNAWGHVASFDEGTFAALLPVRPRVVDTLHFQDRGYAYPLRFIRHRLLHTYGYARNLVCPYCWNDQIREPRRNLLVRGFDRINYMLGTRRRVGWLLGVWDKPECR